MSFCLFASGPLEAGAKQPDSILTGGPSGPCDPNLAGPTYVAGTDVDGNPVAPADPQGSMTVHLDSDKVMAEVPVHNGHGERVLVPVDVPGLADATNLPDACRRPVRKAGRRH